MLVIARLRGQSVLPRVELVLTTRCSLRCKECSNLIPYFPQQTDYDENRLISDLHTVLDASGRIYRLILMGGEVFMHKSLLSILQKLKRENRIDLIHVITNGTILPDKGLLEELAHKKVVVSVSLIPGHVSENRPAIIHALKLSGVKVIRFETKEWSQLGIPGFDEYVNDMSPESKFLKCCRKVCHSIFEGKYYICPRSYAMEKTGQVKQDEKEFVAIRDRNDFENIRDELKTLIKRKSLLACTKCNGDYGRKIEPYEQLK
jgi:organic radical activating enzyme